jgi:predicted HTH transcriptional regulator
MANIDLKELSARESERVEWKKNVADIDQVIKTIVAFANDISNLGGGYVVCGAEEGTDEHGFQKVFYTGLTASRLKEIEGKVLKDCRKKVTPPIIPITEEIPVEENRRVLVFIIAATGNAHSYRAGSKDSSTYYIRVGRDTLEARNSLLTELLIKKNQLEPWDRRINKSANTSEIDLIILREYLQEMGLWSSKKSIEDFITDKDSLSSFIPPLAGKADLIDEPRPRNFTIIMFGKNPLKFFPGAYTIFSIYRGKDRSEPTAERYQITGTIVQQTKRLIELLNTEAYTAFDKTTDIPNQVKYPIRALQEAVVNALVHRDYESNQPTRITVFIDRIEINSPGSLPRAINKEKFIEGKASPYWRNQSLAYFFNKLQLAQAEGQGIPTILRLMKEKGCPSPVFEFDPESVVCTLPAHPRHQLMRELTEIENKIVIGNKEEALEKLEEILDKDPYNFRALDLFCEVNNLLGTPLKIYNFLDRKKLNLNNINTGTLVNIAESFAAVENNPEFARLANELLSFAVKGQLEEKEIIKIAISLRKIRENEKAVEFIDNIIAAHMNLKNNSSLRQQRARARMDLAKRCIETGKDRSKHIPKIRARAWEQCRKYLDGAEIDLNTALENVTSPVEKDYILQDMVFLKKMKKISRKPPHKKNMKRGK